MKDTGYGCKMSVLEVVSKKNVWMTDVNFCQMLFVSVCMRDCPFAKGLAFGKFCKHNRP